MKAFKLITSLLILATGCIQQNTIIHQQEDIVDSSEVINLSDAINHVYTSLDTLTTEIKFIPLETNDESIVSDIKQLVMTSDYIYINDHYKNGSVIIFKSDGSFVKRLPHGGAPYEISKADKIYYEPNDSILYVHDDGKWRISKFTRDGDYISYDTLPALLVEFVVHNGSYVLIQPSFQSPTQDFTVHVIDSTKITFWSLGADYDKALQFPYIRRVNNCVYITKPKDNHIYSFDGKKIFKKYKILTNTEIDYTKITNPSDYHKLLSSNDFCYSQYFYETRNYQIIPITHKLKNKSIVIRNKKNGMSWFENIDNTLFSTIFTRDFGVLNYNNNVLYDVIMPAFFINQSSKLWDGSDMNGLISPKDMEKLKNMNPDDNPIIVLFKLKDEI